MISSFCTISEMASRSQRRQEFSLPPPPPTGKKHSKIIGSKPAPGCPNFEIWMNIWTLCNLLKFVDTIQYITTFVESMEDKRKILSLKTKRLQTELDMATKNREKSDEDLMRFTIVYDENIRQLSQLNEQYLEDVKFVTNLVNKRKNIQNYLIFTATVELPKASPPPTVPISKKIPTSAIASAISTICQSLKDLMFAFSISFKDMNFSKSAFDIETIISKQKNGTLKIDASDVRGDGACGIRAFLTSVFVIKFGIVLPRDPEGMISLIAEVKILFRDLIQIIASNPLNHDFITGMLFNPDNGSKKANIYEYFDMVVKPGYQFTNFELRVLIILFNLAYPDLTQVNVIRKTVVSTNGFEEQYQSFSKDGIIEPVSMKHINILYTGGHYKAIFHITEGILQPIFSVDESINI